MIEAIDLVQAYLKETETGWVCRITREGPTCLKVDRGGLVLPIYIHFDGTIMIFSSYPFGVPFGEDYYERYDLHEPDSLKSILKKVKGAARWIP